MPDRTGRRRIAGLLDDAVFLLLVALAFPAAILVVGLPIVLAVRLALAIAGKLQ